MLVIGITFIEEPVPSQEVYINNIVQCKLVTALYISMK